MSYSSTILLYLIVIIMACFCAGLSQYRMVTTEDGTVRLHKFWFALAFVILWIVSVCTDIGVDRLAYIRIIQQSGFNTLWSGEPGFNLLCMVLKTLCLNNYEAALALIVTINLLLFFFAMYKMKDRANLGLVMFAFMMLAYFRFYLVSMHLASALLLVSFVYLTEGKNVKSWIFFALACLMHYSSILLLAAYGLYYVLGRGKRKMRLHKILLIIVGYALVMAFTYQIYDFATNKISIFQNYSIHGLITQYSGLGIMQFVFYVPIFMFVYAIYRKSVDKGEVNRAIVFALTGFMFAMLGYKMNVFSRTYEHFLCLYMVVIPEYLFKRKNLVGLKEYKFLFNYRSTMFLWICCVAFRGWDVLNDILQVSSSSGLQNWSFYWPF